jgi:hypothetical protein
MPPTRRAFAKQLALGALATVPATALRADFIADVDAPESTSPAAVPTNPAQLVVELVKQLDSKHLDDETLGQIRGHVEQNLSRSRVLGAFALTNADEPAPVFSAWRAEG